MAVRMEHTRRGKGSVMTINGREAHWETYSTRNGFSGDIECDCCAYPFDFGDRVLLLDDGNSGIYCGDSCARYMTFKRDQKQLQSAARDIERAAARLVSMQTVKDQTR